jgi:hypothetical protein
MRKHKQVDFICTERARKNASLSRKKGRNNSLVSLVVHEKIILKWLLKVMLIE